MRLLGPMEHGLVGWVGEQEAAKSSGMAGMKG